MKNKRFPLVSIVILNYNGLHYLKKTIPKILSLNYPTFEIIVVDNGSSDESLKFLKTIKRINVVENKKNLGYSKGKNIGIKKSKGKYILLLDEDILIENKEILSKLIEKYKKDTAFIQVPLINNKKSKTEYYGIYFSVYGVNSHKNFISLKNIMNYSKETIKIPATTGGCMFFSKYKWNKIGGFDESQKFNLDDFDIGSRAYIFGYQNLLYTKEYFTHIGAEKQENIITYINRFKLVFSGHARSIIKNYNLTNLIIRFPFLLFFQLSKALKYSLKKKNFKILFAFFQSVNFFIKYLPDTIKQRKIIQSKRIIKKDIYLKIKPPTFI